MTMDNVMDEGEIDIMTLNEIVSYLAIDTGGQTWWCGDTQQAIASCHSREYPKKLLRTKKCVLHIAWNF